MQMFYGMHVDLRDKTQAGNCMNYLHCTVSCVEDHDFMYNYKYHNMAPLYYGSYFCSTCIYIPGGTTLSCEFKVLRYVHGMLFLVGYITVTSNERFS